MRRSARTIAKGLGVATAALLAVLAGFAAADPVGEKDRGGQAVDAAFRRGNEAYARGDYVAAVEAYERVASLGVVHEDLYYNLANAYYKAGKIGLAIFNYERALALDPDQPDARRNLETARAAAERFGRDRVEGSLKDPFWIRAVTARSRATFLWFFLGFYYACFAALVLVRFLGPGLSRAAASAIAALFAAGALVFGALFFGRLAHDRSVRHGIVLPDEVTVKEGPSPGAAAAFRVHAGLKVRLVEQDQEWVRIRLSNGLEGWLRQGEVGRL